MENDKGRYCFVDRWRRLWSRDGSGDAERGSGASRVECECPFRAGSPGDRHHTRVARREWTIDLLPAVY